MMNSLHRFAASLCILAILCCGAAAQSANAETNRFARDGIAFDYPVDWSITEDSTPEALQIIVTRKGSSVQVMIIVKRDITLRDEVPAANRTVTEPLIKKVAHNVGEAGESVERASSHIKVGGIEAEGVRLYTSNKKRQMTGEVFWFRTHLRFINLAFVRSDADESQGSQLWRTIRTSLEVDAPVIATLAAPVAPGTSNIEGGVLNGKAFTLPAPAYPSIARSAHASGTVVVQVIIDEQGNVSAAHAVSGHPLLRATCVAAARQAKFSPTLLEGEPVKVAGVITYNFATQ
jgi:TonB family protein